MKKYFSKIFLSLILLTSVQVTGISTEVNNTETDSLLEAKVKKTKSFLCSRSQVTLKKERNRKNKFQIFDIDPLKFELNKNNDLVHITSFSRNNSNPVLTYDYSPLYNGSAVTSFEAPSYVKKNKGLVLELVMLTHNEPEPISGRVSFLVELETIHSDGTIPSKYEYLGQVSKTLFVNSALENEVFNHFNLKVKLLFSNINKKNAFNLKLTRLYKTPDNYQGSVSILSARIHWNQNRSLSKQPTPDEGGGCQCGTCGKATPWSDQGSCCGTTFSKTPWGGSDGHCSN